MPTPGSSAWTGCLALGPNWLLYVGVVGPTDEHRHHALQVFAGSTPLTVAAPSAPMSGRLIVVPADVAHRVIEGSTSASVLFVDADTFTPGAPASLPQRAAPSIESPEHLTYPEAVLTADELLYAIGAPSAPRPNPSPEIETALRLLDDDLALSATALARSVGLSTSELSRRFSQTMGIPLRSYRRWRRIVLAVESLAHGTNLTDAAHAAGFSDSAHLTRTFRAMFGIAPSELTATSRWIGPS